MFPTNPIKNLTFCSENKAQLIVKFIKVIFITFIINVNILWKLVLYSFYFILNDG
jgi:hypothetical protein